MPVLSATLAFAITMLILSMVTNVIVETIHRLVRMRQKGMRLMLGHLFDRVIAPMVPDTDAAALTAGRDAFLDMMTINRAPSGTALQGEQSVSDDDGGHLLWPWDGRRLDKLTVEAFMSRLGGSDYSDLIRMLGANSDAGTDAVLSNIAQKFQEFGDEASAFFERRARFLAVVVSIFVAWFVYVQPYEIFATFWNDPTIAQRVIDLQDQTTTVAMAKFAEGGADSGSTAPTDTASAEATDQTDPAGMEAAKAEVKAYIDQLVTAGVPIGWTEARLKATGFKKCRFLGIEFPIPDLNGKSCDRPAPDTAAISDLALSDLAAKPDRKEAPPVYATILWLLLGGLLVGLGGPFWYDLVKSLSSIRSVLGAGAAPVTQVQSSVAVPQSAIDHFKISAAGRDAVAGAAVAEQEDEPDVG